MTEPVNTLSGSLSEIATTLCSVWRLTLSSGQDILMTDHDEALNIKGELFLPQHSLQITDRDERLDFAADGGAIKTHFNLPELNDEEVLDGALEGARLTHYRVNWRNTSQIEIIATGRIGPVKMTSHGFEAEWLGLSTLLERNIGRVFSVQCDASFGDTRCGLNIADYPDDTICPRSFSACRDQFQNSINFRGFPYLIGDDAMQSGAQEGEPRDGRSRYQK